MLRRICLGMIMLAALVSGCNQPTPTPTPSATSTAAATPEATPEATPGELDTSSWIEFEAPDQSFTVKLPSQPEFDQSEREENGQKITFSSVVTKVGGVTYQVNYTDFADAEAAQAHYEELVAGLRETASNEEHVQLDGRDGIRFELKKSDDDVFYDALFPVETRVYDILIVHGDDPDADSRAADAMVRSVKFKS